MSDELPNRWAFARLQEVVAAKKGKKPAVLRDSPADGFVPYLDIHAIEKKAVRQFAEVKSSRLAAKDDLFVVWDGARSGWIGGGITGAIGSTIMALTARQVESSYLRHFIASQFQTLNNNTRGTGIPHVDPEVFWNLEVPLAPLAEQRRIVAKLETLLGKVDASQQRLAKMPVLLKRFRQSVLAAACSGRLTADWREDSSNVQPASEVIAAAKPADDLPSGWAWCALGDYVENLDGKRVPISSKLRETRKGAFPYYGASGVIDSIDGFTHEGEFVLIGEDGANLLSRSTPIAFLAKGRIWVNNHAHVLRCKHSFPNAYVAAYINSIDLAPYVSGTAQPKLNQANMNTIPVPVPPLPEQLEIVRRVEGLFALADQLEVRLAKARGQVEKLTPSLLARAFAGQLVPQDPTNEPAEDLLERIKSNHESKSHKDA
ncbi:MAG: restriction endonuclease subunit S [Verrucomicrobia bacterium]|jgi:type I restriction enzyme S subunit|nr:restriction endonuclease subunit S [Verrucomicrobiota bacterium]